MRPGIFAKTFAGTDPAVVLASAAAADYQCVQYNMACSGLAAMPDAISDAQARSVAAAAGQHGLSLAAVSGTYNMIHPDPGVRDQGLERLRIIAEKSKMMGTRMITLCTGTRDPQDQWRHHPDNTSKQAWSDLCAAMAQALVIAEDHDVDLGIEPELANVVNSAAKAKQLITDLASHRIKIVMDGANLFEQETLPAQRAIIASSIDLLAGHIAMVHAKDRLPDGRFVAAGKGVLDYAHYITCLKRAGFTGPIITHGLAATEAEAVAAFLKSQIGQWA